MPGATSGITIRVIERHQVAPDMRLLSLSLVATVCVWIIGWPLFKTLSQHFADAV